VCPRACAEGLPRSCDADEMDHHRLGHATLASPDRHARFIRSLQVHDHRDDLPTIRDKVTAKLHRLDDALTPTAPAFLPLLDVPVEDPSWQALEAPQRRQRTLDALKRILLRESQVQPLLLVVENLHWIDAEPQAVLDTLVESLPAARLFLLTTYRPEYRHGWGNKTYYMQLRLDPLPRERA
jgi:predicted ATPase